MITYGKEMGKRNAKEGSTRTNIDIVGQGYRVF
jgi:hypothetical protein